MRIRSISDETTLHDYPNTQGGRFRLGDNIGTVMYLELAAARDEEVQRIARRHREERSSEPVVIHMHRKGVVCTGRCWIVEPAREDTEDDTKALQ